MSENILHIAILGATSEIARNLILSVSECATHQLTLFARNKVAVEGWLLGLKLEKRYKVKSFSEFVVGEHFDVIINFVGIGNPAQAIAMGNTIFEVTQIYDELALNYLKAHPDCRYLFLSSGAVYGSNFEEPVSQKTVATISINQLSRQEWYGVAKLHAECRHRAHPELSIIDIRVFNFFSRTHDIEARFLITDILRAVRDKTVLVTSSDYIVRDFLHPSDFYSLVSALLSTPNVNSAVDCYTRAPVDKPTLLLAMKNEYGLRYEEVNARGSSMNATGYKPYYYSLNRHAANFGYQPRLTSLEGLMQEIRPFFDNIRGDF
jgi:nucleoside-diphosphate-sugar epimerase